MGKIFDEVNEKVFNTNTDFEELQGLCIDLAIKLEKAEQQASQLEPPGYKEPADTDDIDVWRIEAKGLGTAYYENDIRIIEDMLKECDYDEGYIITKHKMNAKEYKELPEFTGF